MRRGQVAGPRSWKQFCLKNIWFCKIKVLLIDLPSDVSLDFGGRVCFWGAVGYVHSAFFSLGLERWTERWRGGRFSYRHWGGVRKEWQQEQQWVKQTPPKQQSPLALSCLTSCSDSCWFSAQPTGQDLSQKACERLWLIYCWLPDLEKSPV